MLPSAHQPITKEPPFVFWWNVFVYRRIDYVIPFVGSRAGLSLFDRICQHTAFYHHLWLYRLWDEEKINVYESFIEGAKEGFHTAVTIIPYLVAILVGIAIFRASGAMDFVIDAVRLGIGSIGLNTDFVEALPTMLMKPLSGSGARGMMLDAMSTYGADSFVGRLSSIVQGSCDTTFYVVALYYGSIGIKNTRYTVPCALLADLAGALVAIAMAYLFFG